MMKRFFYTLAAFAAIAVGCTNKEFEPVTPDVNDGAYTFKALISDATKTSIDGEGSMAWQTGDKIAIYDGDFEEFTLKGEALGAEATFTGDIYYPEDASVAVCPFDIASEVADEMLTVVLPATYDYDAQSTHAPMIATGFAINDKQATLKFKHLGGLFKVTYNNIPEEAKFFCFESENKQIAGEFYIEDYTIANPVIEVGAKPADGNIVSYSISSTFDHSSMSFYVPVPVGEFDFNISLRDAEGKKIAKSSKTKRNFTIARGDYVIIPDIDIPKTLTENFSSTTATSNKVGEGSNFTTSKITNDFDYLWSSTGSVFVFQNGIRLGTGSATGSVSNSTILSDVSAEVFTVKVYAAVWNTDGGKLTVTYNGESKEESPSNASISSPTTTAYDASLFAQPTEFVFKKVENVDTLTIGSSLKRIIVDKVEVIEGGTLPAEFGVSTDAINVAWDDTEASFDIVADSKVSWTVSAEDGITPSKTSGSGNATITLSFSENEQESKLSKTVTVSTEYEPVVDLKTYTVSFRQAGKPSRELDGDGSKENPYSTADALYLINHMNDGEISAEAHYVAGTICEIKSYYSSGKSINYYIGTVTEKVYVYGGRDLGNGAFNAKEDLSVGDELIVYGKFQKFVQNETITPELVNSYIYSYNGATSILTGISLGDKKEAYMQNDEFVKPAVTASYKGKDNAVVTEATTFTGYDMATVGTQTVTASYTEGGITKTATYNITVADNTDYTISTNYDRSKGSVTVKVNDAAATTAKANQSVVVNVTPNDGNMVKSFKVNNVAQTLSASSYAFTMPAENVVVDVEFDEKPAELTVSQTSFSAVSGNLNNDANISYVATKGNGTTAPVINSNKIRLYKPSGSNPTGGILTLTANNGAKITSVKVTSNRANGFNVAADGNSVTASTSGSTVYTVSDINASEVTFTNKYADSNDISSIEVTYYGGTQHEPEQLVMSTVSVDTKTSSTVKFKWNAVEHATGYKVKVGDGAYGETQAGTTFTVPDLEPETSVTIYVYAVGNGVLYLDSTPVSCTGTTDKDGSSTATYTALFGSSYNSKGVSAYNASWTATNDGFTVNLANWNNNNNGWEYIKAGNKNTAYIATITTAAAIPEAISKIKVTIDAITSNNINSIKLYMGDASESCNTEVATIDKSTGEKVITISSPAENKFYKLSFDCKAAANGSVQVSKVIYTNATE